MSTKESRDGVIVRIAAVLDAVESGPMSATQLAQATGLAVSTTHRLAMSLVEANFLRRDERGAFSLGTRFTRSGIHTVVKPYLARLRAETGETAQFWVRRGDERLCVATADSPHELRVTLPEGARLALPLGSAGQVLAGTARTDADFDGHGWVTSHGARTPGITSISAPVRVRDRLVGAVCLAAPDARLTAPIGDLYGSALLTAVHGITATLERL